MSSVQLAASAPRYQRYYRPAVFALTGLTILAIFWFTSRYPSLLSKAEHVGQAVPSMAYSGAVFRVTPDMALWQKILYDVVNWLNGMKVGMTFAVLFGALLHTVLQYYPLKVGKNLYLNSLKGALIGVPMGVCANCAVPAACGVTRGNGRVEMALGFLFSSPNFNPIVLTMTFIALPLAMGLAKYTVLLLLILVIVPYVIGRLERNRPLPVTTIGSTDAEFCGVSAADMAPRSFGSVLRELLRSYARNLWLLARPTLLMMIGASVVAATALALIPWQTLLSEVTAARLVILSVIAVAMPVPIALDVMFAAQLYQQGAPSAYVMLFAMTLGTYSVMPTIYLWREVSKPLAVILFVFFIAVGIILGAVFGT